MPINRHMTYGDRQAEAARQKNLERLRKLAASVPAPEEPVEETGTAGNTSKPSPSAKDASATKPAAKSKAAKPEKKAVTKKAAPAKKKSSKK